MSATPASSLTARLALARDLARDLLGTLDRNALAGAALRHLARLVASDAGSVVVEQEGGGNVAVAGLQLALEGTVHERLRDIGAAARAGAVDVERDTGGALLSALARAGARHAIVAPLVTRARTFGALVVLRRDDTPFHPDDVAATAELAGPLALALDNARLHENLERSYASLRTAQEALVRRERLAAIGTMAAVLAHEVRTPIAVLFNAIGGLERMELPAGDASTLIRIMDEETRRLERLVEDLLELGRPPRSHSEVDAWEVLSVAVGTVRGTLPPGEAIVLDLCPKVAGLEAVWDLVGVRQAAVNLLTNACQAIAGGRGTGRVSVCAAAEGTDRIRLTVADDGPGIQASIRARMFDPFITTRPRGVGLGLTIVRRAVDDHGGELFVTSQPGGGTRFDLVLPRSPRPG